MVRKSGCSAALLLFLTLAFFPSLPGYSQTTQEDKSSCVWCHLEMGGDLAEPAKAFANDVHARHGLSCADCHGGDPTLGFDGDAEAAMDPAKGYVGVPRPTRIPAFCGRCHSNIEYMRREKPGLPTDQERLYFTSVHGRRLKAGDEKVATCASCHRAHGVLPPSDPESSVYPAKVADMCGKCHANPDHMSAYGIPTDQVEKWKKSVHGVAMLEKDDLGAPTCNDCHGNHGAVPPGITSISRVCGQCHPANDQYFQESPHKVAFDRLGVAECEFCHGNHDVQKATDEMLGTDEGAICVSCHTEDSPGYAQAQRMRAVIDSLRETVEGAEALLHRAEKAGGLVDEARFVLQEASTALKQSRTVVHKFDAGAVEEVARKGLESAKKALSMGQDIMRELQKRRWGLAAFLVLVLGLIAILIVKIRDVDRKYGVR